MCVCLSIYLPIYLYMAALVLTTHYMDKADVLADRIAVSYIYIYI